MQAIGGGLGRGGNQGEPVNPGGSGSSKAQYSVDKADNINPHAPDCYFYYYSNCSKGSQCKFRHCSAALGTEEACDLWLQKQECKRQVCAFRHSVPERQRSAIPCFWESQSIGCLKPHCPFLHTKPRPQIPTAFGRLDKFKKKEFDALKVKTLDEIREEQATSTTHTTSSTHHQSYNRIYTPSLHTPISSTTAVTGGNKSSSEALPQTSFKLTSVLKTTGLTSRNQSKSSMTQVDTSSTTNHVKPNLVSQSVTTVDAVSTTHQGQQKSLFSAVQLTSSEGNTLTKNSLQPCSKVGVATMAVKEPTKSLFGSRKDPSSVFSPNYRPTAGNIKIGQNRENLSGNSEQKISVKITQHREISRDGRTDGGRGRERGNISLITWGDESEGTCEGARVRSERRGGMGKKEARVVRFQNSEVVPKAKKVKLTAHTTPRQHIQPLPPVASSSPIRTNRLENEKERSSKVGVAIGGRGVGGVNEFHVKTLKEIRAEKRKKQNTNDGSSGNAVPSATHPVTTAPHNDGSDGGSGRGGDGDGGGSGRGGGSDGGGSDGDGGGGDGDGGSGVERKVIRIKKRSLPAQEKVIQSDERVSEKGREGEKDGGVSVSVDETKPDVLEEEGMKNGVSSLESSTNVTKRRKKLARTPLATVQATPITDMPTMTSSEMTAVEQRHITNDDQMELKSDQLPNDVIPNDDDVIKHNIEPSVVVEGELGVEGVKQEISKVEVDKTSERKMSISEMKAQIQSELQDHRVSDSLSLDLLDSELAEWEDELGEVGEEGEGVEEEDHALLDSKTDDDLMLDIAEFL